ncbi:NACHT and WD repeat domain-containing protein 2 [Trichonephila clavata]|uniref:NACHT and WD repeat domain-containing protein 2 n=1 Tax=Trichonephila clavata TaxID=2740835 RepID=A0A8X6L8H8_TRICU|nr:NACHT and WD repeat domain-containing protein 2 [Trichonephila clavata]
MSETELEDLISLDDIVLDDVYQYHMPPVRRIPPLLWTRIRRDLPNYLSEREADGSCPLQAILADFEDMVQHLTDSELIKQLNIVADGMRLGGVILAQHPDMLASQIIGRLLPVKDIYPRVKGLIEQCDNLGTQHCALVPAFHILHTPGGPLKYSLEGHPFAVFGFCLTSDQRFILTISNKFLMFDLMTGEITCDINPEIPGICKLLHLILMTSMLLLIQTTTR